MAVHVKVADLILPRRPIHAVDNVTLVRVPEGTCGPVAAAPAPTASPASGAARWTALPGWLLLAGLLALPAAWLLRLE